MAGKVLGVTRKTLFVIRTYTVSQRLRENGVRVEKKVKLLTEVG